MRDQLLLSCPTTGTWVATFLLLNQLSRNCHPLSSSTTCVSSCNHSTASQRLYKLTPSLPFPIPDCGQRSFACQVKNIKDFSHLRSPTRLELLATKGRQHHEYRFETKYVGKTVVFPIGWSRNLMKRFRVVESERSLWLRVLQSRHWKHTMSSVHCHCDEFLTMKNNISSSATTARDTLSNTKIEK